jgi:hypothetical protein
MDIIIHTNPQTHQILDYYGGEKIEVCSYYFLPKAQDAYWEEQIT